MAKNAFRCRYDYYWVSVFEVEYKEYSGSQTRMAFSETPTEALPLTCRPSFGVAWLTKDKFKVNKTYDCWYVSGISKVSLHPDGFFSCQAKGPSSIEMIRQYFFLLTEFLHSLFIHKKGKASYWRWETLAGVISGFLTSMISISFVRILQLVNSWLTQTGAARMVARAINIVFLKRACFLVAYFSFMGWLMIHFGKRIGLPEIYRLYNY
uniref:Uncharacterized protein n=2 Tax=Rhizophora mucronata TaxID=61149 RepID=A0A2P2MDZ7_RHIMU